MEHKQVKAELEALLKQLFITRHNAHQNRQKVVQQSFPAAPVEDRVVGISDLVKSEILFNIGEKKFFKLLDQQYKLLRLRGSIQMFLEAVRWPPAPSTNQDYFVHLMAETVILICDQWVQENRSDPSLLLSENEGA